MALKAVFFDVRETLVDEECLWCVLAERDDRRSQVVRAAALGVFEADPDFFRLAIEVAGRGTHDVADVRRPVAFHVRHGPRGRRQRTPAEAAIGVDDLVSLPEALASFL